VSVRPKPKGQAQNAASTRVIAAVVTPGGGNVLDLRWPRKSIVQEKGVIPASNEDTSVSMLDDRHDRK
jgi:hypothetical protein